MVWRKERKGEGGTHDDVRLVLLEQGGGCFGACARGSVSAMGEGLGGWVEDALSAFATCRIVYCSLTVSITRPTSRVARSGALFTVRRV